MKYIVQLSLAISAAICLTTLLIPASRVQGRGLRQHVATSTDEAAPNTLQKILFARDTKVTPADCCAGEDECCGDGCCGSGCCGCSCRCEPICCPRCVVGEVEKKCWKVECDFVCIPKFRWPWERSKKSKGSCDACCDDGCCGDGCCGENCCCDLPKCGKVKTINVLEQHKYTCKECGYEWDIKCVCRQPKKRHH